MQKPLFTTLKPSSCLPLRILRRVYRKLKNRGVPQLQGIWSIGIYTGRSPLTLASDAEVKNPVLTAIDVKDVPAVFVADPFIIQHDSLWYMFFEVLNARTRKGEIGLATSQDGLCWQYQQIILDEPFHLSYPYVFQWNDRYYMIPESRRGHAIRLYEAIEFPTRWQVVTSLIQGDFADASIFRFNDYWWLFTTTSGTDLRLFFAKDLLGQWMEHPASPILQNNPFVARPGGRVLVLAQRIVRFTQSIYPTYGSWVQAFEITELTPITYREKPVPENPILQATGSGWNRDGMHHIDACQLQEEQWIAAVDGIRHLH